mmetsp:Transcript_86870/g.156477  ORF Transcript_86870/g.156477 Transcript_86870/m.156477 type:complete len:116 (-) Transcript_86870:1603-1950(-)
MCGFSLPSASGGEEVSARATAPSAFASGSPGGRVWTRRQLLVLPVAAGGGRFSLPLTLSEDEVEAACLANADGRPLVYCQDNTLEAPTTQLLWIDHDSSKGSENLASVYIYLSPE